MKKLIIIIILLIVLLVTGCNHDYEKRIVEIHFNNSEKVILVDVTATGYITKNTYHVICRSDKGNKTEYVFNIDTISKIIER